MRSSFAIKVLRPPAADKSLRDDLDTEVRTLLRIRDVDDHIIWHVATYRRGNDYAIVFPWADHGNLRDYWTKVSPTPESVNWVIRQMFNLAEALKKLHSLGKRLHDPNAANTLNCRHGDLKPENILVFNARGVSEGRGGPKLVITDVGLAKFHIAVTSARSRSTKYGASLAYIPPEFDLSKDNPTSRKFDIWSIGCVFLEFVVWLLYGGNGVDKFTESRYFSDPDSKFYEFREGAPQIHEKVRSKLDEMRDHERVKGKTALNYLLDFIVNNLLQVNIEERATAEELSQKLQNIAALNEPAALARAPALLPLD